MVEAPESGSGDLTFRIIGVGADIVRISLVKRILTMKPHHIPRLFHPDEIQYCEGRGPLRFASYAARFAAKEAFLKALGKRVSWNHVWVSVTHSGCPRLHLSETLQSRLPGIIPYISLSHDGDYALAFVILTSERVNSK